MKLTILQQDLIHPLQSVARSVGIRSTLPVLANILLQTEDGKLKLSATNLDIGVIKKISANIIAQGELTIPAKTLLEIISSLPGGEVTLEAQGDQLKITTKNFHASLNGISANEFPAIPIASDKNISVNLESLRKLPQITFAAASDEGRPTLTGILTEIKKDFFELVATDGFRLAHRKSKVSELTNGHALKTLIPRKTLEEVVRIITEEPNLEKVKEPQVEIGTSENQNQIIFKVGETTISSRLIEGQFPNWDKIIPQTFENKTIIDRAELLKAIKLASVFAKDAASIIKIEAGENKLKLTSEAKELGDQQTELDAKSEGAKINIAFNSKYLIDALSAISTVDISIEFSGNLSPALIKPIGEDDLEYVVMPIRLS